MAASIPSQPYTSPHTQKPHTRPEKTSKSKKGKGKENLPGVASKHSTEDSSGKRTTESTWNWTSLTDPSSSRVPPIYTKDGSYFFALVGSSVKIHSVATGQVVSTLTAPRHSGAKVSPDTLTSAVINPANAFQLITGCLDGRLMIWDYMDAVLLQTIDVAQPIHFICAHADFKDSVFVAASRPGKSRGNDNNAVVLHISLKSRSSSSQKSYSTPSEVTPVGKMRSPSGLAISSNGAWLVAVGSHKVYIARTSALSAGFTKYVSPECLTCLAFHPLEEYFATGDRKGNVRLWYCLNDDLAIHARGVEKRTQTTSLHWHAHAVSSVAFTANGAYLLSGGEEAVLVIWQLHTGKKEFVPRIGAPISTISTSRLNGGEEEYLLGLVDATYTFVSAGKLKITRCYSRVKIDPTVSDMSSSSSKPTPLAVHSVTSTLILPSSHPSSLQIYAPSSSTLVAEIEVSPSNRVSRRDEKAIEPSRVERTVISASGRWMATIDARENDDGFRPEVYLKVWAWDSGTSSWVLNTRIDRPHGLHRVTDMSFSPSKTENQLLHLVTTGADGYVKLWRLRGSKVTGNNQEFWLLRSSFSFRSEIANSISWARDGSLLVLSLGPYVALYDPVTNSLRETLTSPECQSTRLVKFIGSGGRYVAIAGRRKLLMWDIISRSVRWHYVSPFNIEVIVPHPDEETFAVFYNASATSDALLNTKVAIFSAASSTPTNVRSVPFDLRSVAWYAPSHNPNSFSFVGVTGRWSIVVFGDNIRPRQEEGSTAQGISAITTPQRRTMFQDIFGKSAFNDLPIDTIVSTPKSVHALDSPKERQAVFDAPAYLMPPLHSFFQPMMATFLEARITDTSVIELETDDEDVDMEEDSHDLIVRTQRARTVDKKELDLLTNLFRTHSITDDRAEINGILNGSARSKINGTSRHSVSPVSSRAKINGIPSKQVATAQPAATLSPSIASSPATIGKKRKKSLG
ncbi:WD40 repeat-like protein [Crucibulum laeve]|uniref:WD40 repeat-like protein n=1 Tax=Crucibulum laeve TaxID=68775 RepID=A0A5C3LYL2_9AGAR|nr:WD40 repeat-like protein [Crucibulum laeve]